VTWSERTIFASGSFRLPHSKRLFRDWKREGHGVVNLRKAIRESCDVYFYDLAYQLGIDRLHSFLAEFGFGEMTGIDSLGEASGLLPSRAWKRRVRNKPWYPGETVMTGIGQGFMLMTPLQLASFTATLATRGERVTPRLVRAVRNPVSGTLDEQTGQLPSRIVLSDETFWDQVLQPMEEVIHSPRGTAYAISRNLAYRMAGKTGTAQVSGLPQGDAEKSDAVPEYLQDHALFIGFAPAEQPTIAVAVIVENGGSGGRTAAPIARLVLDQYLGSGEAPLRLGSLQIARPR
jgi:penicillin-binding protein 2